MVEAHKRTFLRLLTLVCHHLIQDITANILGTFRKLEDYIRVLDSRHIAIALVVPVTARADWWLLGRKRKANIPLLLWELRSKLVIFGGHGKFRLSKTDQ
jgi:hypothetical protein